MSSFGDGNRKTEIEENLNYIYHDIYDTEDVKEQKQFLLDVMDVLRYICDEWYRF